MRIQLERLKTISGEKWMANKLDRHESEAARLLEKSYAIDAICLIDSSNFELLSKEKINSK